jgi:acetoin utilization deacetylase AcuC-like enzyme
VEAVALLCETALRFRADAIVVSLGVDAVAVDSESPLRVTEAGYAGAGRLLSALRLPTVLVQEGGHHLPTLGELVRGTLAAWD